jgi:alpha-ketoglutarate-dependent taurine dioxygenase
MVAVTSMPSFQATPESWHPQELAADTRWRHRLSPADQADLRAALQAWKAGQGSGDGRQLPMRPEQFPLGGLSRLLEGIQHSLEHHRGVFLLQDFPLDCSEEDSCIMFAGLLAHVGWLQQQTIGGEYLQPVQDEGQAQKYERRGSKHNLGLPLHNDGCDVVAFLCRRAALEGGETILVSPGAVHNRMLEECPELLAELYGHYHNAWQDYMFPQGRNTEDGPHPRTWEAPIFSMTGDRICARYSRFYIDRAQEFPGVPELRPRQLEALNRFDQYLYDAEHWQFRRSFLPGDVLLLNNHIVFHTRTAFRDGEQPGQKRQLYRAWLAMPNSRPISPALKDFFGNTAAGSPHRCCVKDEFLLRAGTVQAGAVLEQHLNRD